MSPVEDVAAGDVGDKTNSDSLAGGVDIVVQPLNVTVIQWLHNKTFSPLQVCNDTNFSGHSADTVFARTNCQFPACQFVA